MGQTNAGLPQPVTPVNLPVGMPFQFSALATLLNLADGSEWLQCGIGIPYQGKYAAAAKLDHLKMQGIVSSGAVSQNLNANLDVATDGNGTIISCIAGSTSVNRSTDGGKTWAAVATTGSGNWQSVIWAGNRFILAGCNGGTNLYFMHSPTGAVGTWVAGTTNVAITGGSSANMGMAYNPATGTVVLALGCSTTSQVIWRCTAGSTFTSQTQGAALNPANPTRIAYYAGVFAFVNSNSLSYSTNDGVAWTVVSTWVGANISDIVNLNGVWLITANNATFSLQYMTATDVTAAANWTLRYFPFANYNASSNRFTSDGNRVCLGFASATSGYGYLYTTDGTIWRRCSISAAWNPRVINSGAGIALISDSANVVAFATASFDSADYIGTNDLTDTVYYRIR